MPTGAARQRRPRTQQIAPLGATAGLPCSGSCGTTLANLPWLLLGCLSLLFTANLHAGESVDPRFFGINIPRGEVIAPDDLRVIVRDGNDQPVVGKVHAVVGEYCIVLLPDGRLVTRAKNQTTPTEKPFEAASPEDLAAQLVEREFAGFKAEHGRHYVFVYNCSQEFARVAARVLDSMLPGVAGYAKSHGIAIRAPDTPLVVVMFRSEDEYQRYRRMPRGATAYYNTVSNRVVLYEQTPLAKVKPELARQQAISTIAHEGAHQILSNIGVQQRLSVWPMWIGEGIAEYLAPTTVDAGLRWKGAGQVNDLRMFELENYLKSRDAGDYNGEMIEQSVGAVRLTSAGYAAAWAITHYLAKNRSGPFHRYVRELGALGPLEGDLTTNNKGDVESNLARFGDHFGKDNAALEARIVAHLRRQPYRHPFAEAPHYVGMFTVNLGARPTKVANVFLTKDQAENWRNGLLEKLNDEQKKRAGFDVRRFDDRAAAENHARRWVRSP